MNIREIKLGEGLGEIKFGMSREQVRTILGEPDDVDQYSDSDLEDDSSESWHYDEMEISLSFDEDAEWKLVTIAVSSPEYLFNGKKLIGLNQQALIKELSAQKLGESETEDWSSEEIPNHKLVSYPEFQVNFWLENDELAEIQWGPIITDEDTVQWPS